MTLRAEAKGVATLFGFIAGAAAGGLSIGAGVFSSLIVVNSWNAGTLPSTLSVGLLIGMSAAALLIGIMLLRGSAMIWKLSVYGGALNLALGIVLFVLFRGINVLLADFVTPGSLTSFLSTLYLWMAISALSSGALASAAMRDQLARRFAFPSPLSYKIKVASPMGKTVDLDVRHDDTLDYVKERISELQKTPTDSIRLIYRGRNLSGGQTLRDLNIREGDKLTVIAG